MKLEQITETLALAKQLMGVEWIEGQPTLIEQGWTFKFAKDKRTVGWCRHSQKTIEVSKYYLDSHPDEIKDTILHEIAHALVGPNHGHDYVWRRMCVKIGANPRRTTDKAVFGGDYNYTVGCNNEDCTHQWTHGKHRIKQAYYRYYCKWCHGPIFIYNHKTGEISYTTPARDWADLAL
jgi:predicted SprT family Zn-dependent metalloprotease